MSAEDAPRFATELGAFPEVNLRVAFEEQGAGLPILVIGDEDQVVVCRPVAASVCQSEPRPREERYRTAALSPELIQLRHLSGESIPALRFRTLYAGSGALDERDDGHDFDRSCTDVTEWVWLLGEGAAVLAAAPMVEFAFSEGQQTCQARFSTTIDDGRYCLSWVGAPPTDARCDVMRPGCFVVADEGGGVLTPVSD